MYLNVEFGTHTKSGLPTLYLEARLDGLCTRELRLRPSDGLRQQTFGVKGVINQDLV